MMMNPVLRREMRTSLRNWRVFGAIMLYVLFVAGGAGIYLYVNMFESYNYGFDPRNMVSLYAILCAMQMGLVLITTPALAAGSISGERERQTLDLLLVTKMSQFSIVIGKLVSSMGLILLMVIATLPIFAVVFYFGGVTLPALLGMIGFILLTACMAGSISIFFSCIFKRTVISIVMVYLVIGVLCFGTLLATALYYTSYWNLYQKEPGMVVPILLLVGNPGVGFFSVIDGQLGSTFVDGVFRTYGMQSGWTNWIVKNYWVINAVANVAMTGFFLAMATYFVNPIKGKRK